MFPPRYHLGDTWTLLFFRRTDAPNEYWYHNVRASIERPAEEASVMEASMQSLEDLDGEDGDSVDEDIDIEDEQLELNYEQFKRRNNRLKTSLPTGKYKKDCRWNSNVGIQRNAPRITRLVEDTLIDPFKIWYDGAKERVTAHLNNLVGKVNANIVQ